MNKVIYGFLVFALVCFALVLAPKRARADSYPSCTTGDINGGYQFQDYGGDYIYEDASQGNIFCTDPLGGIGDLF